MENLLKHTEVLTVLLIIISTLFTSCAHIGDIETESAQINFYFAPKENMARTFTNMYGVTWTIERAVMLPGEIGIHWDRVNARSSYVSSPVKARHDVSGKISPKIYGYFAVNLLDSTPIQKLTVGSKHYDHIHMILLPESEIATKDSVQGIANYPELKNNSLFISGKVSYDGVTKPFEFHNSTAYRENDLGDILIDLSVFEGEQYTVYIHPDFSTWFDNVKWAHFNSDPSVIISENSSDIAFMNIESEFKADNSMSFTFKKVR